MLAVYPEPQSLQKLKELLEALDTEDEIYAGFLKKLLQRKNLKEIMEYGQDFLDYGEKRNGKKAAGLSW